MQFNNREKNIINKISLIEDLNIQKLLEKCFDDTNILSERNFLLIFNKNLKRYEIGLTINPDEDIPNIASLNEVFAIQLNEFVKTIRYLNQNNYLDIVQTTSNYIEKPPIIKIGRPDLEDDYNLVLIQNNELAKEIAFFNCSKISARSSLKKLIENEFLADEDIKYKRTLDITTTTSRNSNRLVILNILGFFLSCLAIWYSFNTNKKSQENEDSTIKDLQTISGQIKQMGSSLDAVSVKLKLLPTSISEFEKSINDLSSTNNQQAQNLKSITNDLNISISGFQENVRDYQEYIERYGSQLNEITNLTNEQLKIWKDQQRVLLNEFNKKPIFTISKLNCREQNDTIKIDGFIIKNEGELEAEIQTIHIAYQYNPTKFIMQQCFQPFRENRLRYVYNCRLLNSTPQQGIELIFKSENPKHIENSYKVEIAYSGKYKSEVIETILIVNDCK